MALSTADVAALSTAEVAALSTKDIAVLTTAQIGALTTDQVAALSATQIGALTTAQAAALSTDDVAALSSGQIAAISTKDLAALTTAAVGAITTSDIGKLTTSQVASLTATQIGALTTDQVAALSTAQIGALGSAQIAALQTSDVSALTTDQIDAISTTGSRRSVDGRHYEPDQRASQLVHIATGCGAQHGAARCGHAGLRLQLTSQAHGVQSLNAWAAKRTDRLPLFFDSSRRIDGEIGRRCDRRRKQDQFLRPRARRAKRRVGVEELAAGRALVRARTRSRRFQTADERRLPTHTSGSGKRALISSASKRAVHLRRAGARAKIGCAMSTAASQVPNSAESVATVIERAKSRQLTLPDLIQIAQGLGGADAARARIEVYKNWIAFNSDHSLVHLAYFNYSVALREVGDLAGAINALQECARVDPKFAPARINLGRALEDAGDNARAVGQWRNLVDASAGVYARTRRLQADGLAAYRRVLENSEQYPGAEEALRQAVELRPDKTEAGQHWIAVRQRQCKWPTLLPSEYATPKQVLDAISPISLAAYADDPMFQLAKAYMFNKTFVGRPEPGPIGPPAPRKKVGTGKRLRIGYVSSDLREHAVGFALCEVFELHDKSTVEIFAYYSGDPRSGDTTHDRIRAAVDQWRDIGPLSDLQAAQQIADDAIDILVDVNGYTKHARTKIFAYRPAPVVVNWCGYPGTMGSPYHHYLIADEHIIPPEREIYYSERVLRIACNQPIDRKRQISAFTPTRAQVGLPDDAFVYASLNGMQKLTANCFTRWMTILRETPGSVLWLLTGEPDTNQRLRDAATERGVSAERIFFAHKAAPPHHLARIALADLFLDTTPYGAHSTAADALTVGLPILTLQGRSFASRFCSSVVAAAGLEDLICHTPEEYVQRAIAFGREPQSLARYRDQLRLGRESSVLRDIPALARRLEELFWQMQSECEQGATPRPDLTNLDIYYDVGAELDLENIELLDERSYRSLYLERLAKWNACAEIAPDKRLWGMCRESNATRRDAAA